MQKIERSWCGWGAIKDPKLLLLAQLHESSDLEYGNAHTRPIGRTQFTEGSFEAKFTINLHSCLHTTSTFLAFMMLKMMKNIRAHGFGSGENAGLGIALALLLNIWAIAGTLNRQANYYKNIERLTGEYDIDWLTLNSNLAFGTLYLFYDENKLHYLIRVETEKKFDTCSQTVWNKAKSLMGADQKDVYFEIVSLENITEALKIELLNLSIDAQNGIKLISLVGSRELKELIAQYPHHLPKKNADSKLVPTKNAPPDYWFFPLCASSQLPSASSGFLLGYLSTNSVGAGIVTALFNWIINIINTMPAIANRYGKENNLGRIEDQPFTSIVLNWFVLGCLKNIIPFGLSLSMLMSLSFNSIIPTMINTSHGSITWGLIPGLLLFPHMTSTFLSFILFALKKLNLSIPLTLHNDLVNSEYRIGKLSAELLGWRYTTISLPLLLGCSPETVAKQMAVGNALGAFGLLFIPSFDVVIAFLEFVAEEATPVPTAILTTFVLVSALIGAILSAKSQLAIYEKCANFRQQELMLNNSSTTQPNPTASNGNDNNNQAIVCYASREKNGPLIQIPNPVTSSPNRFIFVKMPESSFFNHLEIRDQKAHINLSNSVRF